MNLTLIYPMFAMVIVTFAVALISFRARFRAIRSGQMSMRYFQTFSEGTATLDVLKTTRHYANLFEVPMLFYAGCLAGVLVSHEGFWLSLWAWLFVIARVIHATIHIGANRVRPRMLSFMLGWIAVLGLWISIVIEIHS